MIGINPEYNTHKYYNRILSKDCIRIHHKFNNAELNGIFIIEKSTTITELINHLAFHGPIILLINSNQLHCSNCSSFNSRELM